MADLPLMHMEWGKDPRAEVSQGTEMGGNITSSPVNLQHHMALTSSGKSISGNTSAMISMQPLPSLCPDSNGNCVCDLTAGYDPSERHRSNFFERYWSS